ncbi:MAG TPA: glycerol-3-phosphate dehydrogenase/oxidase [Candidatus Limnocylindrales bacterium]|nr:glycerol-3-phosphate dehydrogenase/oxidase [Candidatus Limnocylindrales bacterium]
MSAGGSAGPLDQRAADLAALADERHDLVIVGGGIVGAGALLDAASRGMKVALVEQDDIASGTSSRSSRLIHGGLRYLEQLRFGLVREALAERSRLLRLAPHLVRLEPLLFPLYGWPIVHRAFYGSGILLYDLLGSRLDGGFARHLTRGETLEWAPDLRRPGLQGSIVYHDGVEDDARYALAVVRTATGLGARAVTRVRATGVLERDGRADGIRARDLVGGAEIEIRADAVLDATGVWVAEAGAPLGSGARVRPSKGAHLVVPRARIRSRAGMTIRIPGRVVFLVPWPGHWLIGTTDDDYHGPPDRPSADAADVEQILRTVNDTLDVNLGHDDIVGTYAGLRPLAVSGATGPTAKASREHRVTREANGVVRIIGGKYTTYRVMGRDAVDAVLGAAAARARPSATDDLRLVGAADRAELDRLAADLGRAGFEPDVAARLVDRHGTEADKVVGLGLAQGLGGRLGPGVDAIEAEVAWAVRREFALSVDDVLARRTRLAQELPDRGAAIAPRVAAIMGTALGWDPARQAAEVAAYTEGAEREYGVPELARAPAASPAPALEAAR